MYWCVINARFRRATLGLFISIASSLAPPRKLCPQSGIGYIRDRSNGDLKAYDSHAFVLTSPPLMCLSCSQETNRQRYQIGAGWVISVLTRFCHPALVRVHVFGHPDTNKSVESFPAWNFTICPWPRSQSSGEVSRRRNRSCSAQLQLTKPWCWMNKTNPFLFIKSKKRNSVVTVR